MGQLADQVRTELKWHRKEENRRDCSALSVKANADSPEQMSIAIANGAEGIGLVRTEHMCMREGKMDILQAALLADSPVAQEAALSELKRIQTEDFSALFKAAHESGKPFPIAIRLLDGKADELLPEVDDTHAFAKLATTSAMTAENIQQKVAQLRKEDGRGGTFMTTHRKLYEAQVEAIFDAAAPYNITPEIMIPMIRTAEEAHDMREMVDRIAAGRPHRFGVMIETIDAGRNAGEIAKYVQFMNFGTNDLTQEVLGIERNDPDALDRWRNKNGTTINPWKTIVPPVADHMHETIQAVEHSEDKQRATLINQAIEKARNINPDITFCVCGRHAADPESIRIFQELYVNSISVSPTPAHLLFARTTAAKAAIEESEAAREAANAYAEQQSKSRAINPANMPKGKTSPKKRSRDPDNENESRGLG